MRNVLDHYKYWTTEAIKADLDRKRGQRPNGFSVLCSNWQNDFNIGGVIRNANAFLAAHIYLLGRKKYDRRGTVGTHIYQHVSHLKCIEDFDDIAGSFTLVAIDNGIDAEPMETFEWPENTLMAFGQESVGLPENILERAAHKVYIRQYGSVRSLNAACASGIAMYDWCRKNV